MKSIKNSMFLLLGIFVLCMFSQATYAQEKTQAKKQIKELKTLKKGDKIRSNNGQRTIIDRKAKPVQRPATQQNKPRPQVRPVPGNKANVKRPIPNKQARPIEKRPKPGIQNKNATEGRLRGIKQGAARSRAMSAQNQQAMRSGHSKIKAMRVKLSAAKAKVAKEKAANPNSAAVKAKEARIQQAEAKIKAMEQEILNQRKTITNISQQ